MEDQWRTHNLLIYKVSIATAAHTSFKADHRRDNDESDQENDEENQESNYGPVIARHYEKGQFFINSYSLIIRMRA